MWDAKKDIIDQFLDVGKKSIWVRYLSLIIMHLITSVSSIFSSISWKITFYFSSVPISIIDQIRYKLEGKRETYTYIFSMLSESFFADN